MAELWRTGFDGYDTATALQFWTSVNNAPTISNTASRWASGNGLVAGNNTGYAKTLSTSYATLIAGFAFRLTGAAANGQLFAMTDAGTAQLTLTVNASGQIVLYRGTNAGTQLAISSVGLIVTNVWHYAELKATINNSTGAYELHLDGNGTPIFNASGVNTRNTANNSTNGVSFVNSSGTTAHYDDIYVADTTGSAPNNDFYGDTRIPFLVPTGAGNHTDWTPSTGSNWQNVDDTPPNDDTDYNYSTTTNNIDTYAITDSPTLSGTVHSVTPTFRARKDDSGTRKVATVLRISSTDYVGSDNTLSTTYQTFSQTYETDPSTSSAWTMSAVNALEAGVKLTA